jgi:alanine-synthesizing transaminase
MQKEFDKISNLPPYVFAEVNRLKDAARAAGRDIIDFGMGNPDIPTPQHIIDKLIETVHAPNTHRYSASKGIAGLRKAICGYYDRRYDVQLDPNTEAVVTIGSKEGLATLSKAIATTEDSFLVPAPSYPIHEFGFKIVGANVIQLPKYEGKTLPQQVNEAVENCKKEGRKKPLALILNYPCNPTAEVATLEFYEEMVDLCRFHGIYIISDLAYNEIYFEEPTPSILQVKGARDIAVEFTTMSKTYSMPGWRVGFCVGNKELVYALTRLKSYLDYGVFTPIQVAAAYALNGPQECVAAIRAEYKDRRDTLISGMKAAGWDIDPPKASMFAWATMPPKYAHMKSMEFSKLLMEKADVAVSPGIGFGIHGDNHVRISLVENKQRIRQACRNVKKFLAE